MHDPKRHKGLALAVFAFCLTAIVTLALASTTWAAPGAQGTVPTAPAPTSQATPGGGGGGGGNDNGGNDNGGGGGGGNDNSGGGAAAQPTVVPGAGTVCAIGDTGAQCSADNVIVVVGTGATTAGSAVTVEGPFGQPPCPASPPNHNFLNRCYRLTFIDSAAQPLASISGPIQYCLSYGPEQLAAVTNNPASFLVGLAGEDGQWTLVKPNIDSAGGRVCATSNQLIRWTALFAPQASSNLLPTVGGEFNAWWLAPVAALGMFLWLGALKLRSRSR